MHTHISMSERKFCAQAFSDSFLLRKKYKMTSIFERLLVYGNQPSAYGSASALH